MTIVRMNDADGKKSISVDNCKLPFFV
jgi:hypothetical protein